MIYLASLGIFMGQGSKMQRLQNHWSPTKNITVLFQYCSYFYITFLTSASFVFCHQKLCMQAIFSSNINITAALFGKFRFGFQKYFLLLQVSFNISTLAHCTKGNFFSFKAFMTHKLLETRPNGLQGTWNLLSTKFLIHNQRFAENLGLMLTMNQAWYLTKKKSPLTTMRMMTAAVAIAPSVTLCKEWKLVKSMEPRLLDLMHPHLHLWGHLLQCQNCKHLFLSQAYMHQWWGETCWIFQWSIREDQGIYFKSCLIFFNPI